LLKLHTDQSALTFLTYPDFDDDPHPTLAEATKTNAQMESGRSIDRRSAKVEAASSRSGASLPTAA
jgi:hypothetical protein